MQETKNCPKCGRTLNVEMFSKDSTRKDGYQVHCKDCKKLYKSINKSKIQEQGEKYYIENKENILKKQKRSYDNGRYKYYQQYYEKNKENILKDRKMYHEKNRKKLLLLKKLYYNKHKDKLNECNKKYYAENKDKLRKCQKQYNEQHKEQIAKAKKLYNENHKEELAEKKRIYAKENPDIFRKSAQRRKAKKIKLPATLTVEQWEQIKKDFDYKCAYCGQKLSLEQEHFKALSKGGEYTHNNIIPACKSCNCSKKQRDFFTWYQKQDFYNKKRENFILNYLHYASNGEQQLFLAL